MLVAICTGCQPCPLGCRKKLCMKSAKIRKIILQGSENIPFCQRIIGTEWGHPIGSVIIMHPPGQNMVNLGANFFP